MSDRKAVEARRTAIALVRAHINGDRDAALALLRGNEDAGETLSALMALTVELARALAGDRADELLGKLALAAAIDE